MNILDQTTPRHSMVMMISERGSVIKCYHDQTGKAVYRISEAFEHEGELYIGSFTAPFMGKLKL